MAVLHYCTLDDVNAYTPQVPFTSLSKPSATAVAGMIEDAAIDMDTQLANVGYVVPVVSGAQALAWLKRTCLLGALGMAQAARSSGVTTAVDASNREVKNLWLQMYEARMAALLNPQKPDELADAPRTEEQLEKQPEDLILSAVDDDGALADDPVITRQQVL